MAEYFYKYEYYDKMSLKKSSSNLKTFDKALLFYFLRDYNIISILFIRHNKLIRLRKKSRSTEKTFINLFTSRLKVF